MLGSFIQQSCIIFFRCQLSNNGHGIAKAGLYILLIKHAFMKAKSRFDFRLKKDGHPVKFDDGELSSADTWPTWFFQITPYVEIPRVWASVAWLTPADYFHSVIGVRKQDQYSKARHTFRRQAVLQWCFRLCCCHSRRVNLHVLRRKTGLLHFGDEFERCITTALQVFYCQQRHIICPLPCCATKWTIYARSSAPLSLRC
jgi:hypothetical protein